MNSLTYDTQLNIPTSVLVDRTYRFLLSLHILVNAYIVYFIKQKTCSKIKIITLCITDFFPVSANVLFHQIALDTSFCHRIFTRFSLSVCLPLPPSCAPWRTQRYCKVLGEEHLQNILTDFYINTFVNVLLLLFCGSAVYTNGTAHGKG